MKLIAYHGKQEIKDFYLTRVTAHQAADELVQGYYWQNGKGCAVGCTIHGSSHQAYESELGIPRVLARLEDGFFERLPVAEAQTWPGRFLSAIMPGADLSQVVDRFIHWLLVDPVAGVIKFARTKQSRQVIKDVATLYSRRIAGEVIQLKDWELAKREAYAYAYAYAYADAYADAATAAADAAAYADADAYADAATAAVAADAAASKKGARMQQAEKLLELLAAAPLVNNNQPRPI